MTNKARAKANIAYYEQSEMDSLEKAYKSASHRKWAAWHYCQRLCREHDGWGLKVIHRNTWMFTAGFEYVNQETGEVMFMYITPNYNVAVSA